jgi:hypothetical protein
VLGETMQLPEESLESLFMIWGGGNILEQSMKSTNYRSKNNYLDLIKN